jgi:hypothetical protein
MLHFKDHLLIEALKIVKKSADKEAEKAKYRDDLNKPKEDEESNIVGKVDKYTVLRTHHIGHTRDYEKKPRDAGLTNADYMRVITKFVTEHTVKDNTRYHLFYKKDGRYSNLVVKVEDTDIIIITVMQMAKRTTQEYFSKPGEMRLTLENNSEEIFIVLDLHI